VLHDPQVVEALRLGLQHNGLAPGLVVVELTESVMLNAPDKAIGVMRQIVDMGLHLSIDDYGAGFSSLTYVKQLPAQELKIDKSFVSGMPHNAQDRAIVQSSIDLAHDFGLKVLAEGIEDADTVRLLQQAGCDLGQGWYYARALPLDRFMDWSPPAHLAHTPPPTN
jgi:EAL domain-containing protein (putative c-di-GMP-specific phosphodiesterase class I)